MGLSKEVTFEKLVEELGDNGVFLSDSELDELECLSFFEGFSESARLEFLTEVVDAWTLKQVLFNLR